MMSSTDITKSKDASKSYGYDKFAKAIGLILTGFIAYRVIKKALNEPQWKYHVKKNTDNNNSNEIKIIDKKDALQGREWRLYYVNPTHFVLKNNMFPPFHSNLEYALFGMGCFWGIQKLFDKLNGIYATNVGYADGYTKNPTYKEIKSDKTGHNEVIRIIFDPKLISYSSLLITFFENHNMTLSTDDNGDTYHRSVIYCYNKKQNKLANKCLNEWKQLCRNDDRSKNETIYTEIL